MSISRRQLYAAGEPLGECVTRKEAGRLVCGGGGGGGSSTSMPAVAPELKPLVNLYTQQAMQLANTPWQAYQGQRYADINGTQRQGLDMVQQRAMQGSQTMGNAENALNQAIQGGNTNPYLDSMVNRAQRSVADNFNMMTKPQIESSMVRSGSFGNSGLQQMLQQQQKGAAQQMGDIATQMYGNAYNSDRANQMQAIGMAPTFGNAAYNDAGQLLNAGNIQQQNAQNKLDFNYQQAQDKANYPFKQLQTIGGVVGQSSGTKTTSSNDGK